MRKTYKLIDLIHAHFYAVVKKTYLRISNEK